MSSYMKENNIKIKDGTDMNTIMRDMMSVILEGALDEELSLLSMIIVTKRLTTVEIVILREQCTPAMVT